MLSCTGTQTMSGMNENFVKWKKQYGDVFTIHLGEWAIDLTSLYKYFLSNSDIFHVSIDVWLYGIKPLRNIYCLGPLPCVVLASADAIREAFITKGHDFDGRLVTASSKLDFYLFLRHTWYTFGQKLCH